MDKYGLILKNNDRFTALYETSKWYVDNYNLTEYTKAEFFEKYKPRQRHVDENLDEYNDYLSTFHNAHNDYMVNKCPMFGTMDINFDYFCQTIATVEVMLHPELVGEEIDRDSALMFTIACNYLDNRTSAQISGDWLEVDNILNKRKHKFKALLSDTIMIFSKNKELKTYYKQYSNRVNPTFLTKYI